MNHHNNPNGSSAPPAFMPAFYASSYDDDDEFEFEFSAEQVHSDNGVAFIAPAAPAAFSADMAARHQAIADGDDDDDALFVPSTKYRDTQHVFANGPCDLVFNSESFSESSFFNKPGKTPVFVLENAPKKSQTEFAPFTFAAASSPLSPSSYSDKVDVPQKESCSYFCVNPSIPSRQSPTKIMDTLKAALLNFECDFEVVKQWSIKVNLLCVAEQIAFTIELTRAPDASSLSQDSYEIDFVRQFGDETKFVELAEYIRSLCSEIDDEALPFLSKSLEPWLDAKQEVAGRRHAIKEKEAASLIQELNAELHPDTLFEVTKMIKDHCRHKGNRKLFLQADHKNFLRGLKWMLTDCEEVARFGVFILLQFAKDQGVDGSDEYDLSLSSFFTSPYDKSSFALLLDEVLSRQQEAPCGKFTSAMVEQVQQSWVFA